MRKTLGGHHSASKTKPAPMFSTPSSPVRGCQPIPPQPRVRFFATSRNFHPTAAGAETDRHKPAQPNGAGRPAIRRNSPVTRVPHFAYLLKTKDFASLPLASLTHSACSPAVSWRRVGNPLQGTKIGFARRKKILARGRAAIIPGSARLA